MKKISFIIFVLISTMMFSQSLQEFRTLLHTGEKSEKSAKILLEKSSEAYQKTNKPIYASFFAVGKFFMAKHAFSPLKKMSYFKEGKDNLEGAIKKDPKNLEIRLMRLITQEKAPKLLGYAHNISEDRKIIMNGYKNIHDEDLKLYIKNYLKL